MREIKFRAWVIRTESMPSLNKMRYEPNWTLFQWELDGVTMELMQYTGLKDKHGKEIYEGDVVKHKQYEQSKKEDADVLNGVVQFHRGAFFIKANGRFSSIYLHDIDGNDEVNRCWHGHNNLPNIYEGASDFEVIGNIYQNPDLLK